MNLIKDFGQTARSLSKNPLGIVALFIVLIYALAALLVGASDRIDATDRHCIVIFLVAFPPVVLGVFGWLVSSHHEKLYAPHDFQSDAAFLDARTIRRPLLAQLDKQIDEKVTSILTARELIRSIEEHGDAEKKLKAAASRITREIRQESFFTVDAVQFTGNPDAVFEYPISAFSAVSDLLNDVYNEISTLVGPYEYGHSWLLKHKFADEFVESERVRRKIPPGTPYRDRRTLAEVGIRPGTTILVTKPVTLRVSRRA